jgi:hypothetical protein
MVILWDAVVKYIADVGVLFMTTKRFSMHRKHMSGAGVIAAPHHAPRTAAGQLDKKGRLTR